MKLPVSGISKEDVPASLLFEVGILVYSVFAPLPVSIFVIRVVGWK